MMDSWTEAEFVLLCCGLDPDGSNNGPITPETERLLEKGVRIKEMVHRAVATRALVPSHTWRDKRTDRFMNHFKPKDAIQWAGDKFPDFPFKESEDERQMRQAIKDLTEHAEMKGWDIFSPDWAYIRQFPVLRLDALCALSVGLQQAFAVPAWTISKAMRHFEGYRPGARPGESSSFVDVPDGAGKIKRLEEFHSRFHIAPANLKPRGSLAPAEGESPAAQFTQVRVVDFVAWAVGMGWDMPPELVAIGSASQKAEPVTTIESETHVGGVQVTLPHMTERLEKLFQVMRDAWGEYDPERPAKQTNIADDIDKAFGWKAQKGGEASRNGQALAALIRPDEQRKVDKRVAKRSN